MDAKRDRVGQYLTRKEILLLGEASMATIIGHGRDNSSSKTSAPVKASLIAEPSPCHCIIPLKEMQGAYPLPGILGNSALNRSNITEDRTGVPLTLKLKVVGVDGDDDPVTNAIVYVWHCDKDGIYSGYSHPGSNTVGQTFLRGIQATSSEGKVTFTTIYPGWQAGYATHIYFQVYLHDHRNVTALASSQITFPQEITQAVYASALYTVHGQNPSATNIRPDRGERQTYQMATVVGSINDGYTATLTVRLHGAR